MQLSTQFVEADVMSAGELDYVAGLGTLCGRFSQLFIQNGGEKLRNLRTSKAKSQADQIVIDFQTDQHTNWSAC
jgi:hypothetical protein